jgi:hypothetical protein
MRADKDAIAYMQFTVFDTDGVTPLTGQAGSCTSSLRKNGTATGESVIITEIGSTGRYSATFTPLEFAFYDLEVSCPDDRVLGETFETYELDVDVDLENIITQLRDRNIQYERSYATKPVPVRNVAPGVLNYITVTIKDNSDPDFSTPVISDIIYFWYKTMGDKEPIKIGSVL